MKYLLSLFILSLTSSSLLAQDFALEQLEQSPRHHEWVQIEYDNRTLHNFVAYPEHSENTLAVIVLHENRGLTDWVRSFADQVAEAGYLAIAPDMLSEFDEVHNRTSDFFSSDEARDAIYRLDPIQITRDLKAVREYISGLPSSNGSTVIAGFCWGGSQTFRFATHSTEIDGAFVFYGSAPDEAERIRNINAPVYGFYGENDQRINATIPDTEKIMDRYGKTYDYVIYEGAGHAFMRAGDDPGGSSAVQAARDKAWERFSTLLENIQS
ncbi:MAG: dienelactone hydrolase family protein [Balneolaceae bacterium]